MLRLDRLTYRIGPRVLLDGTGAAINAGHRVGLVGRNGTGKTTLLRLITGTLSPESGEISIPSRWSVGITSQDAPSGDATLIETVLGADRELAALTAEAETATDPHRIADIHTRLHDKEAHSAPARAARILAGLGFDQDAQRSPCNAFSGGWRMRVALASLLFTRPDLLLLDEPTNHLDLEATLWLEDYLRSYPGTILLVSHDRDLLNRVPTEILHLENAQLTLYQGGYDRFEETRRMRLELNEKARVKQAAKRAHLQSFVDRFRAKASKAKQAQSRIKMLERLQPIPEQRDDGAVNFDFPEPGALAPPIVAIDDVTLGYDGKAVLKKLSLRIDPDDRIALLGANGNGKSTLIKLLAGRLAPMDGDVSKSGKLRVGYFAQHQTDELDLSATPIIELGRRRPDDRDVELRTHLGHFGFSQQRAETKIANLSGGEKARLLFALMSCVKPHLLLLDEPTNHLDMDSRRALIDAINAFEGAVVIISHDPHILELTVDRFWLVDRGKVEPFDGDMDDYRALLIGRGTGGENPAQASSGAGNDRKDTRKAAADRRSALRPLKRELDKAESEVAKLEREKARLTALMADPKLYERGKSEVIKIQAQLAQAEAQLHAAEHAWIELHEKWDAANAGTA
ncbi:MAG: ABC-F family ATP-binding cassette domain-containing protein [Rhodobacteraceae bacterium]|nr:ABC-F family ATP-binding cassette domain-containing protein [Paracoccaceae bacterium]